MKKKVEWHPAFCYAIRLDLREEQGLEYADEYNLTSKPLKIDLMIIRKTTCFPIANKVGRIFEEHNVLEYKSPQDALNVDTFYKSVAYACLYKISPQHSKAVDPSQITITLVRDVKPKRLFKSLTSKGFAIEKVFKGIYYVYGSLFKTQIVVSSELDATENKWLKSLSLDIDKTLYLSLYDKDEGLSDIEERMASVVRQVVSVSNKSTVEKWKEGDEYMCDALREIMKPEIEQWKKESMEAGRAEGMEAGRAEGMQAGRAEGMQAGMQAGMEVGRINAYYEMGMSVEDIALKENLPIKRVKEILEKEYYD